MSTLDAIKRTIRDHSSPTTGQGDIHGGQRGYIVYEPSLDFIAHDIVRKLSDKADTFQTRVVPWLLECFGFENASNKVERNQRFLEEALELTQSLGMSRADAHLLVDYVYDRPLGQPEQEVGGVMVTLAALCLAHGACMHQAGETELKRVSTPEVIAKIRAKQATKPKGSPLPGRVQ